MTGFGISTMVWGRVELFKRWAENVKKVFGDIPVSVAYSEDFYHDIILEQGFIPVLSHNDPLGRKANDSLEALEGLVDFVITTGSDDFFSDNAVEIYESLTDYDYVGFSDCFFYDEANAKTLYWPGYDDERRAGEPIGAGKMVSSEILDRMNWRPFVETINRSLDYYYHRRVLQITNHYHVKAMSEIKDFYVVDIKTEVNINGFDKISAVPGVIESDQDWKKHVQI